MVISKSKRQLAQLLIEAGVTQFPKGANWAAQDKDKSSIESSPLNVVFYSTKPPRPRKGEGYWFATVSISELVGKPVKLSILTPNWHQTVLSRDEFDRIVAETAVESDPDSDGWTEWCGKPESPVDEGTLVDVKMRNGTYHEAQLLDDACWSDTWGGESIIAYRLHKPEQAEPQYCESVMRSIPEPTAPPTLDQLLQDWRNADDYAQRKQTEADEAAAMRDERWQAVQARAGKLNVTVGWCEPVVVGESDWVEWKGGEQPLEDGTLIDVEFEDGVQMFAAPVGITPDEFPRNLTSWGNTYRSPSNITRYRLARP